MIEILDILDILFIVVSVLTAVVLGALVWDLRAYFKEGGKK